MHRSLYAGRCNASRLTTAGDDYPVVLLREGVVLTPNFDHSVNHKLHYTQDIYIMKGIVGETAEQFGVSGPARYVA